MCAFIVVGLVVHAPLDEQYFERSEQEEHCGIERIGELHAFLPQGMRTPEELDDKLDGFETREGAPCVTHRGRSGTCDACGGVSRTGNSLANSFQLCPAVVRAVRTV